jgi:hypothetical protein
MELAFGGYEIKFCQDAEILTVKFPNGNAFVYYGISLTSALEYAQKLKKIHQKKTELVSVQSQYLASRSEGFAPVEMTDLH